MKFSIFKTAHFYNKKFALIFYLLIFLSSSSFGQFSIVSNYTRDNGLSSDDITYIAQDRKGFIWIGTNNGLNRFDGYNFNCFYAVSSGLPIKNNNFISNFDFDEDDNIWIASSGGLLKYEANYNFLINLTSSIYSENINVFNVSIQDNILWLATDKGVFFSDISQKNLHFNKYDLPGDANCSNKYIIKALKDFILISSQNGFYLIDIKAKRTLNINLLKMDNSITGINNFFIDLNNQIWISTNSSGLFLFNLSSERIISFAPGNFDKTLIKNTFQVTQDKNKNIWIASTEGLFCFNSVNMVFNKNMTELISRYIKNKYPVNYIYLDYSNNLWFSELSQGVFKFDLKLNLFNPVLFSSNDQKMFYNCSAIVEIDSNSFLIASDKSLKSFSISKNHRDYELQHLNKFPNKILSIADFSKEEFFLCSKNSIFRYNIKSNTKSELKLNLAHDQFISDFIINKKDTFWIATNKGLIKFQNNLKKNYFDTININHIKTFSDKYLVICNDKNQLFILSSVKNDNLEIITQFQFSSSVKINVIKIVKNIFLIGTDNGLLSVIYDFSSNKFQEENFLLAGSDIKSIVPDNDGNVWIGSNNGIIKHDLNFKTNKIYKTKNGLQSNFFSSAGLFTVEKNLIFIGEEGFEYFDPNDISINKKTPNVVLTGFNTVDPNGNRTFFNPSWTEYTINHNQMFSLSFACLDFSNPNLNQFAFRIPEIKKKWNSLGTLYNLLTIKLEPGDYTLEIVGSNNDGIWSQIPLKLKIKVVPAFYQTFYFRLLMIVSIALLIVLYIKMKLTRLEKQRLQLEAAVANRTEKIEKQNEELKILFENLKSSEEKFRSVLENTFIGIFRINKSGQIIIINQTLLKMLGFSTLNSESQRYFENTFFNPNVLEEYEKFFSKNILTYIHQRFINVIEESKIQIRISLKQIFNNENEFLFYDGLVEDITEQTKSEIRIKNYINELSELNRTKDKLFSIIAHDLRNPLSVIITTAEFVSKRFDKLDREKLDKYLGNIVTTTKNMNFLLENLLDWSLTQSKSNFFQPKLFNLNSFIEENVQLYEKIAEPKNIKLTNHIKEKINCEFDEKMLNTVLRNLISNAIKFTPIGGKVDILGNQDSDNITIKIIDSGIGIEKEKVDKIFQLDPLNIKKGTLDEAGTGIGLKICYEFIKRHNGSLWVESEKNIGSVFAFMIPKINSEKITSSFSH